MTDFDHAPLTAARAARLQWMSYALLAAALVGFGFMLVTADTLMVSIYTVGSLGFLTVAVPIVLAVVVGGCGQIGWNMYYRLRPLSARDREDLQAMLGAPGSERLATAVRAWIDAGATLRKRDLQAVSRAHLRMQAGYEAQL